MLKKIFIILILSFVFCSSVFAVEYNNAITGDGKDKQAQFINADGSSNLTDAEIAAISSQLSENGAPMTPERVRELASDGKGGMVTDLLSRLPGRSDDPKILDAKAKEDAAKEDAAHAENMACSYNGQTGIMQAMKGCVSGAGTNGKKLSLVGVDGGDLKVGTGFKNQIMKWVKKIGGFLGLGAIFAIAFGSLKMTLSRGEDEEIKKGKNIIKWGILGFLLVVSGGFIVGFIVNVIYGVLG